MRDARQTPAGRHVTASVVVRMTETEYATWRRDWTPTMVDSIVSTPGEPDGYHRRETTEDGYPLMGSSPAERDEARQRSERIQRQAMRDHPFVGEGRYCEDWGRPAVSGGPWGKLSMRVMCGYGRDTHPEPVPPAYVAQATHLMVIQ